MSDGLAVRGGEVDNGPDSARVEQVGGLENGGIGGGHEFNPDEGYKQQTCPKEQADSRRHDSAVTEGNVEEAFIPVFQACEKAGTDPVELVKH